MSSQIAGDELFHFIRLAREVFHGEPWEQVQHYVERAWRASQPEGAPAWDEVQPLVRAAWE